jgi:hypothetical protein
MNEQQFTKEMMLAKATMRFRAADAQGADEFLQALTAYQAKALQDLLSASPDVVLKGQGIAIAYQTLIRDMKDASNLINKHRERTRSFAL